MEPAALPHRKHCSSAMYVIRVTARVCCRARARYSADAKRGYCSALLEREGQVRRGEVAGATHPALGVWAVLAKVAAAARLFAQVGRQVAPAQNGLDVIG